MGGGVSVPTAKLDLKKYKKGFRKDVKACKDSNLSKLQCKVIVGHHGIPWDPAYDLEFEFDADEDDKGVLRISKRDFLSIVKQRLKASGSEVAAAAEARLQAQAAAKQRAAAEKALIEKAAKIAAEKIAAEKAAREKAAREEAAREAERKAAEKAAKEKAAAEKAAAEKKAAEAANAAEGSDSDDWGSDSSDDDNEAKKPEEVKAAATKTAAPPPSKASEDSESDSDWGSDEETLTREVNTDIKSKSNEIVTMNRKAWEVVINEAQYNIYKAAFDSADLDDDGCLEREEVEQLLKSTIGSRATDDYVKEWMTRVDDSKDNLIQIDEWIRAVIGKDYVITSNSLKLVKTSGGCAQKMPVDADKKPLCIGLVYKFTEGDHKDEVVYFKGMQSTSGYFVSKNIHQVDNLGAWGGAVVVARMKSFNEKLKLTDEKEAWILAQRQAIRLCRTYFKQNQMKFVTKAQAIVEQFNDFSGKDLSCKVEGKKFITFNSKTKKEVNTRTWKEKESRPY